MANKLWTVSELRWHDDEARFYRVWNDEGFNPETIIVKRHGHLAHLLTCLRCDTTEDISFKCQHIEAIKETQFLDYDED